MENVIDGKHIVEVMRGTNSFNAMEVETTAGGEFVVLKLFVSFNAIDMKSRLKESTQ